MPRSRSSPPPSRSSPAEIVESLTERSRWYLSRPWDFAIPDPEERIEPVLGDAVALKAAKRPILAFTEKQHAFLRDFVDVTKPRVIAKTGRGGSKTFLSAIGQAVLAWCLPTFTCTVNAGSLVQAGENYRYLATFADAPAMRHPIGPLLDDPGAETTRLRNGGWIRVLAASERQAKGPHPMMVVLDEACAVDPDIMELVEGQLTGAPAPHGGSAPLYRIQSTPDKLFHPFKVRWDRRGELGYAWHTWGARDCPWMSDEEIQRQLLENDANWARMYLWGEFGSASGTVFRLEDVEAATLETLQDDEAWAQAEEQPDRIVRKAVGVDWGFEHPTVILGVVQVGEKEDARIYVVHAESFRHTAGEELHAAIARTCETWHAGAWLDASHKMENERARRYLSPMGLAAHPVAFSAYNLAMVSAVRAALEQRHADGRPRLRVPLGGSNPNVRLEGAALLRQLAEYSWDPDVEREKPLKENDDFVDALKLAVWGLRRGGAGPAAAPGARTSPSDRRRFGFQR